MIWTAIYQTADNRLISDVYESSHDEKKAFQEIYTSILRIDSTAELLCIVRGSHNPVYANCLGL
jgi:hypothetical protein